ncbi:MAG: HAMP domain-containing histidine kinase [Sphingobacteriaceae bacterium]|nr:HAMP domain-containing histidine kinase [Sphingobacteriaceae bacterium]
MKGTYNKTLVLVVVISWLFLLLERIDADFEGLYANAAFMLITTVTATGAALTFRNSSYKALFTEDQDLNECLPSKNRDAESLLVETEAFYSGLLKSLVSHIAVINSEGKIIATNDSWDRFALENGEVNLHAVGKNNNYFTVCEKAVLAGDLIAADILAGIKGVAEGSTELYCSEYSCHLPESQMWFSIRAVRFFNNDELTIISHENITPTKLAELEVEKMAFDLLQRNKNIEQFSYIVSHNLRAPLANVMGFAELLKHSPHYSEFDDLKEGIYDAAYKIDDIVNDLNNVLQIGSQLFENKTVVYFKDITESVSVGIENIIKNRNVTIRTDFSAVPSMLTVKSYFYSIFYNLIYNSIKYQSPDRNALIEITTKKTENGLKLIFKDNGLGIDLKKNGQKLFGLYKWFHLNTEGKGMGLFIVKTQVETLGGKITATSEVNEGTEFILDFFNSYE